MRFMHVQPTLFEISTFKLIFLSIYIGNSHGLGSAAQCRTSTCMVVPSCCFHSRCGFALCLALFPLFSYCRSRVLRQCRTSPSASFLCPVYSMVVLCDLRGECLISKHFFWLYCSCIEDLISYLFVRGGCCRRCNKWRLCKWDVSLEI